MVDKAEIIIEFGSREELQREFEDNLRHGGTFAQGESGLDAGDFCDLILVHPENKQRLALPAHVAWVALDDDTAGVGVEVDGFSPEVRDQLFDFIQAVCEAPQSSGDQSSGDQSSGDQSSGDQSSGDTGSDRAKDSTASSEAENKKPPAHLRDRLRGLSVAQQQKIARGRDLQERIALERIYGKTVWEPLLRNPQVTIPEVARIARMGALPKPLLELICSNATWVRAPHVRRALLGNPKLSGILLEKILRMTPRAELKLIVKQTAYPPAVRAAARKLLRN